MASGAPARVLHRYADRRDRCRGRRQLPLQEGPGSRLGVTSINKTLTTLAAILETAVEHELIGRNPAKGSKRRLPAVRPHRSWLDRADHITALLDAAREIDCVGRAPVGRRRPLIATLLFAGLRIGELQALRWSDVDFLRSTIRVRQAKTDAGVRIVNIVPILRRELGQYRNHIQAAPSQLVFPTAQGRPLGSSNIRIRMLARAVEQRVVRRIPRAIAVAHHACLDVVLLRLRRIINFLALGFEGSSVELRVAQ